MVHEVLVGRWVLGGEWYHLEHLTAWEDPETVVRLRRKFSKSRVCWQLRRRLLPIFAG